MMSRTASQLAPVHRWFLLSLGSTATACSAAPRAWGQVIEKGIGASSAIQRNSERFKGPTTGRGATQDPLGLNAGDAKLHRYVRNRPTVEVDPSGLENETAPVHRANQSFAPILGTYGLLSWGIRWKAATRTERDCVVIQYVTAESLVTPKTVKHLLDHGKGGYLEAWDIPANSQTTNMKDLFEVIRKSYKAATQELDANMNPANKSKLNPLYKACAHAMARRAQGLCQVPASGLPGACRY
jgi:hypothetical protein